MNIKLYLIAAPTGAGKTTDVRECEFASSFVNLCYDRVMRYALPIAFPYFKLKDDPWNKTIWESTRDTVDAQPPFQQAILNSNELPDIQGATHIVCHGYQLANPYWAKTITNTIEEITNQKVVSRRCWFLPPLPEYVRRRKKRNHEHDRITDEEMADEYRNYKSRIVTDEFLASGDAELLADLKQFIEHAR